jgi:serine/threonine protein kinase
MKPCPFCAEEIQEQAVKCRHCGEFLVQKAPSDRTVGDAVTGAAAPAGPLLAGRYRIVRELGRGGMGVVYLARDQERFGADTALKVLLPELSGDPAAVDALRREATVAMSLAHPNIVRLHNLERDGNSGTHLLVMEYIGGPTLAQLLRDRGRLAESQAVEYCRQALEGLAYAHGRQVLHRDLKPSNLMLDLDGRVKISDFGIARTLRDSMTRLTGRTQTGTLLYMSPEQLRGEPGSMRSDLWSMGCVLYELLAGRPPFATGAVEWQILNEAPRGIEGVSEALGSSLKRALAKKPEERFASADEFSCALISPPRDTAERLRLVLDERRGIAMEFVRITGGTFLMGSPAGEADHGADEVQHPVTLTKGFLMQATVVTQAQWEALMGSNPSHFKGAQLPVENVSWNDCQEFIKRLNQKCAGQMGDLRAGLPTEAQWEYACRAGSAGRWCFGGDETSLGEYAWYDKNSGGKTHEVGTRRANGWGLYDMNGNVWEWCEDWYGSYPAGSITDPRGPSSGEGRVLRGGCWFGNSWLTRSAGRLRFDPTYRYNYVGVRVVLR